MIDETVKALRWIARNDEAVFNAEQANTAADQLEQLQAENERLKAEKLVRCGECKHYAHSEEKGVLSHCTNHGGVLMSLNTAKGLVPTDFCSYGERRDAE